jgi:hypothetical protein
MRLVVMVLLLLWVVPVAAQDRALQLPFHPSDINWNHPLTRGLVNWWRGVPPLVGAQKLYNLVRGSINYGTLTNMSNLTSSGWSVATRPGGTAQINCDGTNDYVITQANAGVFYNSPFSMCFWVNPRSTPASAVIMGTAPEAAPYDGIWLQVGSTGKLVFIMVQATAADTAIATDVAMPTNTWTHVCATYDGSQTVGGMKIYWNGLVNATTVGIDSGFGPFGDRPWNLCADRQSTPVDYFPGALDDVRQYNRALSDTEIERLYHQSLQGDPELIQPVTLSVVFSAQFDQVIIPRRIVIE